jgi:phospholipid/cholesterol/gamma-HCH transport system substrate-binding protein
METRANHVLIGLFTLIVAALAILFALWAAKYSSDKNYDEYDVVFHEAVTGLSKGGIVQYNGIAVGEVLDLRLDEKDPNRVIVRIRVGSSTPIKTDTEAKLAIIGLTGVLQIQLSGGTPNAEPLRPKEGQKVAEIDAKESALSKLLNSTADIATTATDILLRLNRMLSEDNVKRITLTLDHIEAITGTVAAQKSDIAELLRNARTSTEKLDRTLASADSAMGKLDHSMSSVDANLPTLLAKIDKTLTQLEALSRNANGMIAENREAIATFGNQGLTQIGPTITELRALLRQLNRTTERLQDNPAGFILGHGKPKEFVP